MAHRSFCDDCQAYHRDSPKKKGKGYITRNCKAVKAMLEGSQ